MSAASLEMLGDSEHARLRNLLSARLRYNLGLAYSRIAEVRTVDLAIPNLVESAARVEEFTQSNEQFRDLVDKAQKLHDHLEELNAAAL